MIDLVDFASMKTKFSGNMMLMYLLIEIILGIFMQKISLVNLKSSTQAFSVSQLEASEIKVPEKMALLEMPNNFKEQLPIVETNFELSVNSLTNFQIENLKGKKY